MISRKGTYDRIALQSDEEPSPSKLKVKTHKDCNEELNIIYTLVIEHLQAMGYKMGCTSAGADNSKVLSFFTKQHFTDDRTQDKVNLHSFQVLNIINISMYMPYMMLGPNHLCWDIGLSCYQITNASFFKTNGIW